MQYDIFDLTGKKVLITGSAQGLGFLIAEGLGEHGAEIIINDISKYKVDTAVTSLNNKGIKAYGYPFDVTDFSAIEIEIKKIESEVGDIDILVNNAGIQRRHPFVDFPESDWDRVIDVNQKAVFFVSQAVAKSMIVRRAGKIINICSMQSELGRATIIPYAASKGAVKMMTRGMCVELAKYNIQVNGIAPGYFDTELNKALVNDQKFTEWLCQRTPAGRWGEPEELIGAAVFLSSRASDFVNGHVIFVDGGMLAAV